MKLNQSQLNIISIYQTEINSNREALAHSQSKLDAFVSGILTSNGIFTKVECKLIGDELEVTTPPEPIIIEE